LGLRPTIFERDQRKACQ